MRDTGARTAKTGHRINRDMVSKPREELLPEATLNFQKPATKIECI